MNRIYADHNASSPLSNNVRNALEAHLQSHALNPGSVHHEGQLGRGVVEVARRSVRRALGVTREAGALVFTSGATEANSSILTLAMRRGPVVASSLDHPSVVELLNIASEKGNAEVRWIPHDRDGSLRLQRLDDLLEGASLLTVALGNNELGIWRDVAPLARLAHKHGTALHLDAAQVFGRWKWNIPRGVDYATLSAHKAGGLPGVGGLFVASGAPYEPLLVGGHQERGRRAGTENVIGICSMQAVADGVPEGRWDGLAPLRDRLEEGLIKRAGAVATLGPPRANSPDRLPNTTNLLFPGRDSETMLMELDLAGVSASAGSACTAGSIDPSPVLVALGHSPEAASSALRLSIGPEWDGAMVDECLDRIVQALSAG